MGKSSMKLTIYFWRTLLEASVETECTAHEEEYLFEI